MNEKKNRRSTSSMFTTFIYITTKINITRPKRVRAENKYRLRIRKVKKRVQFGIKKKKECSVRKAQQAVKVRGSRTFSFWKYKIRTFTYRIKRKKKEKRNIR